jgi:large subunit ribosomal protein L18
MAKIFSSAARRERHAQIRKKISGTASRPRLCIFRSLNHIYAQIIDDSTGRTLVSASTLDLIVRDKVKQILKTQKAELVGSLIAQRAISKGIKQVVFDRGGYQYHGRVRALAEAARQAGLEF